MAIISIPRRRDACLHFLQHGSDIQATVQWILREFKDEPAIQQATNKEKLATNIITMGGSGLNREANVVAMQQAIDLYQQERQRQQVAKLEAEIERVNNLLEAEKASRADTERDYRQQVTENGNLNRKNQELNDRVVELNDTNRELNDTNRELNQKMLAMAQGQPVESVAA